MEAPALAELITYESVTYPPPTIDIDLLRRHIAVVQDSATRVRGVDLANEHYRMSGHMERYNELVARLDSDDKPAARELEEQAYEFEKQAETYAFWVEASLWGSAADIARLRKVILPVVTAYVVMSAYLTEAAGRLRSTTYGLTEWSGDPDDLEEIIESSEDEDQGSY
jgi:hypothetical protein